MRNKAARKFGPMNSSVYGALVLLVASLLLAGCGKQSPDALLTSAKELLAKNDNAAAVIQIKNALQVNPELPEARFLLGSALLDGGNPAAAELELRKALALKYSTDQATPKLAAAMLGQGQYKKVTDEFYATKLGAPAAIADLQTSIAIAHAVQGNPELSETALKAALAADPGFVPALLTRARQKAAAGDTDGALATVDDILRQAPTTAEAWSLKGDLLWHSKKQPDQALAAYRQALEVRSKFLPAHQAILNVLLQQGKLDEAQAQLTQLKAFASNDLQTKYIEARLAYLRKDTKLARELTQQLLKVAPDSPAMLFLAGSVELQGNSLSQAEAYLARTVHLAPGATAARRALLMTYLRLNQPDKALAALRPALGKDGLPEELYSVAGEVYLQNGDFKEAQQYFSKASKVDPFDPRKRTALALTQLMNGADPQSTFTELQDIAASDKGTSADLALISAHLQRRDIAKAMSAIDALERKQPDKPLAASLRGRVQLASGDAVGARKSFERALTILPSYFPAVASMAGLDVIEKKPAEAKKRVEAYAAKNPNSSQAWMVLAELATMSGASKDEVAALYGKAISANPSESAPRLQLVDVYLRVNDLKQASIVAQNAVAALPERPEPLEALGRVQQAAGEFNQAIASYGKLIVIQPASARPYLRLADAYMASNNKPLAEQSLYKALEIEPNQLDAQRALFRLAIADQRYAEALAIARTVQKQRPKEASGFSMEGSVSIAKKDFAGAAAVYRAALKQVPSPELAVQLSSVLLAADKTAEANTFASQWRKDHPEDAVFLFHLGDVATIRKDDAAAEKAYLAVVQLQPNNAGALNNLAMVAIRMNHDGAIAIAYAEKANQLAPNQAPFMDTLALALGEAKQYEKAIALQTKTIELQPANPAWKLTLAKLYIKSGDKAGARRELEPLAASASKSNSQGEAAMLLKSL